MIQEKVIQGLSGWLMLVALVALILLGGAVFINSARDGQAEAALTALTLIAVAGVCLGGLTVVNPNEAKVVVLFGTYKGTVKAPGFWWLNPLTRRRRVSLRVRNFESAKLKVNDQDGNPIEIAAVVVWKVVETAEAIFLVDDYEHFVHVQSESAVRTLATTYPYDAHAEGQMSLRMSVVEIAHRLRDEIQERLTKAGVEVIESRITHLAYAPEIAGAMLRRQQASAVIAARQKIVEGAVGMVQMALDQLSQKHVVDLDEERKASMVSNLLVVLCSDRDAQPIVNTGTLYQG
ncbi:MAG: SPFH domain-containing protein [Acidobacteriota bacterium]|nr:SPFH domain-containing protein [Acidobacteriota bacterium]